MKFIDPKLEEYCISKSSTPSSVCDELAKYTQENITKSVMLTGKMETSLLRFLIKSTMAKNVLEFGTFTGYSALAMAEALPDDGKLITIDVSEETTKVAQSFWDKSPHGKKIIQKIGQGQDIMAELNLTFDFVFIDADKANYLNYLTFALENLSPRGIVAVDNVLWSGKVLESENLAPSTQSIKKLNDHVAGRDDLIKTMLPIRDGILLIQKK